MMKKLHLSFLFAFIFSLLGLSIGNADFLINSVEEFSEDVGTLETAEPVCYNKTTGIYYTKIESALTAAGKSSTNETIYVIPGANPTISSNCTLASGDTLILPYEGESWDDRNGTSTNENQFADRTTASIATNKKSDVKIGNSNGTSVTLTVNGTLNVGGILGVKVQCLSGFTSSSYAQISLYKGAQIIVNSGGKIDLRGYIKEVDFENVSSGLVLNNGAEFNLPFVVYDYAGGSATAGIYAAGTSYSTLSIIKQEISPTGSVFPFNLFDCPNCQVLTKIYAGSSVNGYISLYTQEKSIDIKVTTIDFKESWNTDSLSLIGSSTSSILYLKSGYLNVRFTKTNKVEATDITAKANTTVINAYGNFELGSLNMTINAQICTVKINTSNVYFPMSYHFALNVKSGYTFSNANKLKIMGGAIVNIEKGAILSNSGTIIVYNKSYTDQKTRVPYLPTYDSSYKVTSNKCTVTDSGTLTINGTYTSKSASSIGGKLTTTKENAVLNLNSGYSSSASSLEHNGTTDYSSYITVYFNATSEVTIAENLKIKEFNELNVKDYGNHSSSGTFKSATGLNSDLGFGATEVDSSTYGISGDDSFFKTEGDHTYTLSVGNLIGNSVSWSTSDSSIATVSGSGLSATLTPFAAGTITLTATVKNGTSTVQKFTKEITIVGEYIDVVIQDSQGNKLDSTRIENATSGTVDVSSYTKEIIAGNCTNSYNLPDYKILRTITSWKTSTDSTAQTNSSSISVSGSSGNTVYVMPVEKTGYSDVYYYLAYMTAHAKNGTSYLTTDYYLKDSGSYSSGFTSDKQLNATDEYCYIEVGKSYSLYAKGFYGRSSRSTSITDNFGKSASGSCSLVGSYGEQTTPGEMQNKILTVSSSSN